MDRLSLISKTIGNVINDLVSPRLYPHREIKRTHKNYWIAIFADLFFKSYMGAEYLDAHNIPETGPALIVANHSSHLDGILINTAAIMKKRRSVVFLAAADVYYSNLPFRIVCDLVNCIPVKRDENDRAALLKSIRLIRRGSLLGIFPEGQRSRDGSIGEAKEGAAIIALVTGCPVIPIGIAGTFQALRRKTRVIKPAKVRLKFGSPLHFGKEKRPSPEKISHVRDQIMDEIKRLYSEALALGEEKQKIAA